MAKAASEIHEIGKYPVQENKEKKYHLGLKIGLGVGIAGVLSFLGYKALTNNNQVSTAEVQRALAPQDKKVEVVKKNYGQEAVKDLNAGIKGGDSVKIKGDPLYEGFTASDYMNAINTYNAKSANPSYLPITEPKQIFKNKKISRKEMKELASEAHQHRGVEDSVKGFLRFHGYTKSSGHIVYISYGEAKLSPFCIFVNKDGELSIHRTRLTVYK